MSYHSFLDTKNYVPMTKEQVSIFMGIVVSPESATLSCADPEVQDDINNVPQLSILCSRLTQAEKQKLSLDLLLFLSCVITSPGEAVLWAWTIHCYMIRCVKGAGLHHNEDLGLDVSATLGGISMVNLDTFTRKIFPFGLPSEAEANRIWDSQKLPTGGNALDLEETWG